jgi:hypothetical protein
MMMHQPIELTFVVCANDLQVLDQRLLASPCLRQGGCRLVVNFNATSAAQCFNSVMLGARNQAPSWLVWVHQDVHLPDDWDIRFTQALEAATLQFQKLAVVGVYGVAGTGTHARRAGHVLDRGTLLQEPTPLPCLVNSLDELLFAVRLDTGLELDPALGFDFYATDLVLQAQALGWQCAVVDACCEHWSATPTCGVVAQAVVQRINASARIFEGKWAHQLPITTPCFDIAKPGDVAAFIECNVIASP